MSASSANTGTKASIDNIFADHKNTKTGKKRSTSKATKAKKIAKTGKKCFFFINYGNFSVISFVHLIKRHIFALGELRHFALKGVGSTQKKRK